MIKYFTIFIFSFLLAEQMNSQTAGQLTITATTVSYGGTYAPYHVVAIWVQSKTGTFIKTLVAYAASRRANLSSWSAVTSSTYNVVDAVTGATRGSHGAITGKWNGSNLTGTVLGDDTYTVAMEMTEGGTQRYYTFQFKKSGTEQILSPANVSGFSNITIKWTPALTQLADVNFGEAYSIYPIPVKSLMFVNGANIGEIQLYTLSGMYLLSTKENTLNISNLKKGIYLIVLKTTNGDIVKKFVKD